MTKKNRSSINPSPRGFTLLEVLIAVLIIGIIATAAVPMLASYAEKAREAAQDALAASCNAAVDRYGVDHQYGAGYVVGHQFADAFEAQDYALRQLTEPTDGKGNVMGAPVTAQAGPFSYGPYITDSTLKATQGASLLLAFGGRAGGRIGKAATTYTVKVDDSSISAVLAVKVCRGMPNTTAEYTAKLVTGNLPLSDADADRMLGALVMFGTTLQSTGGWDFAEIPPAVVCAIKVAVVSGEDTKFPKAVAAAVAASKTHIVFEPGQKYQANTKEPFGGPFNTVKAAEDATADVLDALTNASLMRYDRPLHDRAMQVKGEASYDATVRFFNENAARLNDAMAQYSTPEKNDVRFAIKVDGDAKTSIAELGEDYFAGDALVSLRGLMSNISDAKRAFYIWVGAGQKGAAPVPTRSAFDMKAYKTIPIVVSGL